MVPVPLAALLQDCPALVEPLASAREVQISSPKLESSCCVHADPTRVKQVIINLLSNAIKYNKMGGAMGVASTVGAGSEFWFELDLTSAPSATTQ